MCMVLKIIGASGLCTVLSTLQLRTCTEEYGLSKDVDVSLWLDYRAYHQKSTLSESAGFVIVDTDLHKEYEEFRAKNAVSDVSFLPQNDLLHCWCTTQKLTSKRMVQKYGYNYVKLFGYEVDQLCAWVREKRDLVNADGWENFLLSVNDSQQRPKVDRDRSTTQLQPSKSEEEADCEITGAQIPAGPMSKVKRRLQKQLQKKAKRRCPWVQRTFELSR